MIDRQHVLSLMTPLLDDLGLNINAVYTMTIGPTEIVIDMAHSEQPDATKPVGVPGPVIEGLDVSELRYLVTVPIIDVERLEEKCTCDGPPATIHPGCPVHSQHLWVKES